MAAASSGNTMEHGSSSEFVENKAKNDRTDLTSELTPEDARKRAYLPQVLPEDFLRVLLNEQQLNESSDSAMAHRMQMGIVSPQHSYPTAFPRYRMMDTAAMGRGKLQVDIIEARLAKNYGFTKMDPYVRIKLGTKVFETPTDYNGSKNPHWRKTIMCYLPYNVDVLVIEIYDEKSFTTDELIAFVKYPLPDSLFDGIFLDEWIPLSGKLGEQKEGHINIQMLFTGIDNRNPITLNQPHPYTAAPMSMPIEAITNSNSSEASSSSSGSVSPHSQHLPLNQHDRVQLPPLGGNIPYTIPYSQADLDSIKEMFPSFDVEVIKSILESNDGNKENSIEALLQISSE